MHILLNSSTEGESYDQSLPLFAHVHLARLAKLEDWFKDGSTIVRTLRKGRGRNPYTDSTVKFRMEIQVNDKQILSNYPTKDPIMTTEESKGEEAIATGQKDYSLYESENLRSIPATERSNYLEKAEGLYTVRLDTYTLPSLIIKVIKSMKKNGVAEIRTTRMEKL